MCSSAKQLRELLPHTIARKGDKRRIQIGVIVNTKDKGVSIGKFNRAAIEGTAVLQESC